MNVFVVTSPFQYLCAREAQVAYAADPALLVLVPPASERGRELLEGLVDNAHWDQVLHLPRRQRTWRVPAAIRAIRRWLDGRTLRRFFYGEYNAWRIKLMRRNLPIEQEVYFDDGTLTLVEYANLIRPRRPYHRPRFAADTLVRLQGLRPIGRLPHAGAFEMFTVFDIDAADIPVRRNTMPRLRQALQTHTVFQADAPAGFVGQGGVAQRNGPRLERYLDLLTRFQARAGHAVIYFPHRSELPEVSAAVQRLPGVTYHRSRQPLELELANRGLRLSTLGGIASTALYTLSVIYPEVPVLCATLDARDYPDSRYVDLDGLAAIQAYYQNSRMEFFP